MAQKLIQTEIQQQLQQQRLSQQQMLQVKLLEMPLAELEQNVNAELDDNPALEQDDHEPDEIGESDDRDDRLPDAYGDGEQEDYEVKSEREEREDALDSALEDLGRDDAMPSAEFSYYGGSGTDDADREEMVWGDTTSFYDKLKEQMGELELTEQQQTIMEYLIGSLDSDGLLRKSLDDISDELAIYHSIDVSTAEIEKLLKLLQTFDPAGIGAQNLQECLLLQIRRRPKGKVRELMESVIKDYFEDFTHKRWDRISQALELTDEQATALRNEIRRLNPKPGASLGEAMGRNLQQITPDFIVDTDDDGNVTFTLNNGRIPDLKVSQTFSDLVDTYKNNKAKMNRQDKEALLYAKEKLDKAQGYIDAVKQRRHTLYVTMKAIIDRQKKYFQDGDEADLRPMILKDIAQKTGLDISTISRVCNVKYAQTRWGTFPLRFFFSDSYVTKDGEEMSTRKIKVALRDILEQEDKHKPLSDDALAAMMKKKGFPIARRTVAKYREQLGVPVARLRKI